MNINKISTPQIYNSPSIKTSSTQSPQKDTFPNVLNDTASKEDQVSISAAGSNLSDAMDPPLPLGAMPDWLGGYAIQVDMELGPLRPGGLPENRKFSNLSSGERNEYFTLLESHIHNLYERHGLTDSESINAALNSRSTNEKLHQEFLEGIRNDPRMSELVGRLGIALY
ncbi:hypothetical protein NLK61_25415 [Pseudomonas fuscovaginae UPB0736]|uniref:Uncharacterized protein n=1 Tax=Pseudomonas asplenii TaxID=53407 RepID=A0A1H6P9U5_9PSED|nr:MULTISPECIES: hypothetical protein [Pseudomonas]UUQ64507.1 hypothetical protein NLK61_25415 [Pseudomonas fuscovaginae UPB0736]UZE27011.1 hypothetical protein LOY63_16610 [Pseudomonas asplenii]SEI21777.1 hypothetical protein SAMN05216581_4618 [Pseudomonas fuscovaginae]